MLSSLSGLSREYFMTKYRIEIISILCVMEGNCLHKFYHMTNHIGYHQLLSSHRLHH